MKRLLWFLIFSLSVAFVHQVSAVEITIDGEGAYSFEERSISNLSVADISFAGSGDQDLFEFPQFYADNLEASIVRKEISCADAEYAGGQVDIIKGVFYCARSRNKLVYAELQVTESDWNSVTFDWSEIGEGAAAKGRPLDGAGSAEDGNADDAVQETDESSAEARKLSKGVKLSVNHLLILVSVIMLAGVIVILVRLRR